MFRKINLDFYCKLQYGYRGFENPMLGRLKFLKIEEPVLSCNSNINLAIRFVPAGDFIVICVCVSV